MNMIGLDIGGANLKLADGQGAAVSRPFPLWKHPHRMADALGEMLAAYRIMGEMAAAGQRGQSAGLEDRCVITMTGELADCFETKAQGVGFILEAAEEAVSSFAETDAATVLVYLVDGRFVSSAEARREPLLAAASNWHALAAFAARWAQTVPGILIDIGSTTSDLIPLVEGRPVARGQTDPERLASGELVYTGVKRSPVCAICPTLSWHGRPCRTAQEWFATSGDAYVLSGDLPEEPQADWTADGRPATKSFAAARLARAICADRTLFSAEDAQRAAGEIAEAQLKLLAAAFEQVTAQLTAEVAIVAGEGEFLGRRLLEQIGFGGRVVSLAEHWQPAVSRCGPAHAVAVLARERFSQEAPP